MGGLLILVDLLSGCGMGLGLVGLARLLWDRRWDAIHGRGNLKGMVEFGSSFVWVKPVGGGVGGGGMSVLILGWGIGDSLNVGVGAFDDIREIKICVFAPYA